MLWAGVFGSGLTDLLIMRRDPTAKSKEYTAKSYLTISYDGLLPIYEPDMIYQQDGAPIHTAKIETAVASVSICCILKSAGLRERPPQIFRN